MVADSAGSLAASKQPSARFQYPFAAAPDIIRSHQKDAYFQGVLLERLSGIARKIQGARFTHMYSSEIRTAADLLYLSITTFVGNRTLGEEYCDIVQVEGRSLKLPTAFTRGGYVATTILLPYALNRALPRFRRYARNQLEAILSLPNKPDTDNGAARLSKFQQYLLANLDTLTSPAPVYALSLAVFYFSGAYYHLSKRIWGLRYIFTRSLTEADERVGYEVLGVLLVLQLAVQGYLHVQSTISTSSASHVPANAASIMGSTAAVGGGVEVSLDPNSYSSNNALLFESGDASDHSVNMIKISRMMHTPIRSSPYRDLAEKNTMSWLEGRQSRKCTLCLEPMKDPSATTCGHVFCWVCISDWCREKPECPLCRQTCLVQHILLLRG